MGTLLRSEMKPYEANYLDRIKSGDIPGRTAEDYLTWLVEKSGRYNHLRTRDMEKKLGIYKVPGVGYAWGDGEHFVEGSTTPEQAYANRSKPLTCPYGGCELIPALYQDSNVSFDIGMYMREDYMYSWWNGNSFGWIAPTTEEAYRRRDSIVHSMDKMSKYKKIEFTPPSIAIPSPNKVGMYKVKLKDQTIVYFSWWSGSKFMHRATDPQYAYDHRDDSPRKLDDHATWEWADWKSPEAWNIGYPSKPGIYNVMDKDGGGKDGHWFSYWDGTTWHYTDNSIARVWEMRTRPTGGTYISWKDCGWTAPKLEAPTEIGMYYVTTVGELNYHSWWDGKAFNCWCKEAVEAYEKRERFPHMLAEHKAWTKTAWNPPEKKKFKNTCAVCNHMFDDYTATYPDSECTRNMCPDPSRDPSKGVRTPPPKSSTPVAMAPRAVRVSASRRLLLLS